MKSSASDDKLRMDELGERLADLEHWKDQPLQINLNDYVDQIRSQFASMADFSALKRSVQTCDLKLRQIDDLTKRVEEIENRARNVRQVSDNSSLIDELRKDVDNMASLMHGLSKIDPALKTIQELRVEIRRLRSMGDDSGLDQLQRQVSCNRREIDRLKKIDNEEKIREIVCYMLR